MLNEDLITFSKVYRKFDINYFQARFKSNEKTADYPIFEKHKVLNDELEILISEYLKFNNEIKILLIYADDYYVSLRINEDCFLNFSITENCFLPPLFVLKRRNINKRLIKKALKKICKKSKPVYNTVRLIKNGIRINAINTKTNENFSVKIVI